jgi:hypothetical protein
LDATNGLVLGTPFGFVKGVLDGMYWDDEKRLCRLLLGRLDGTELVFFCSFEGPVLRAAFGMTPSRELGCTVMGDVDECDVGTILWF